MADKAGVELSWVRPDLFVDGLELTTGLDWLKDTSQQRLALTNRNWVPPLKFTSTAPFAKLEYELGPSHTASMRITTHRSSARVHTAGSAAPLTGQVTVMTTGPRLSSTRTLAARQCDK